MPIPRCKQVYLEITPYYHCYTRCVRQSYLIHTDKASGQTRSHRKQWIVNRLKILAQVFAIDIAAYAVMSNHYHLVLHVDTQRAVKWDANEVKRRWALVSKSVSDYPTTETIIEWRRRLADLSWFMRLLNEYIARLANAEDKCKGHFWDSRFKCKALLDEGAVLACMAYVDLNPIRAGIAKSPETSDFTALQERLCAYKNEQAKPQLAEKYHSKLPSSHLQLSDRRCSLLPTYLMAFQDQIPPQSSCAFLPFTIKEYLELVDWTGRTLQHPNKGYIPAYVPSILNRMSLNSRQWPKNIYYFEHRFKRIVGRLDRFKAVVQQQKQKWMQGERHVEKLYNLATVENKL